MPDHDDPEWAIANRIVARLQAALTEATAALDEMAAELEQPPRYPSLQVLVEELRAGDRVLVRGEPAWTVERSHSGGTVRVFPDDIDYRGFRVGETVAVLLVDCPACEGRPPAWNCGTCDVCERGKVLGSTARAWREKANAVVAS